MSLDTIMNISSQSEFKYERPCAIGDISNEELGLVPGKGHSHSGSLRWTGAGVAIEQIAQRAELDSGTAFRLVKTLVMLGYFRQVDNSKRYYLGLKILDLGFNAISRMDLHASAGQSCAAWWKN